jgi:hypothetical protein
MWADWVIEDISACMTKVEGGGTHGAEVGADVTPVMAIMFDGKN